MFSITISVSLDGPRFRAIGTSASLTRIMRYWDVARILYPNVTGDIHLKDIINGTN